MEPCPDCKNMTACHVVPIVTYGRGYVCGHCDAPRWGGVLAPSGPRVVGYEFSNGSAICWRCSRLHVDASGRYPALSYIGGYRRPIYTKNNQALDRHCDECGVLIDADC